MEVKKLRPSMNEVTEFEKIFGVPFKRFWDNLFGFDVIEFHDFINNPEDISMDDFIQKKWSKKAASLVGSFLDYMPIRLFFKQNGGNDESR